MNKLMKIVGGSLVVLAVGVGVTAGAAMVLSERKLNRVLDVNIEPINLASFDPNMERGEYLFLTRGCAECHGAKGEQFRQMMRSGTRVDGTPIPVMPFESLRAMSDTELDALFGFLKSLQPKASGTR